MPAKGIIRISYVLTVKIWCYFLKLMLCRPLIFMLQATRDLTYSLFISKWMCYVCVYTCITVHVINFFLKPAVWISSWCSQFWNGFVLLQNIPSRNLFQLYFKAFISAVNIWNPTFFIMKNPFILAELHCN